MGLRRYGVPPGGAFDPAMQAQSNMAVGNEPGAAVLELALCRLEVTAERDVLLAWSGPAVSVRTSGGEVAARKTLLRAGATILIEVPKAGARIWLAAQGGFVTGEEGPLKKGSTLRVGHKGALPEGHEPDAQDIDASPIRAIPERPEFRNLFENAYKVRHDSNRVGIRLDGPRMRHKLELPSEPATPGVIQITPEGLPIILGPDGPTIGGYPRAAAVASAEMAKLAQLRPGDEVRFAPITVDAARKVNP